LALFFPSSSVRLFTSPGRPTIRDGQEKFLTWEKAIPSFMSEARRREELRIRKQAIDLTGGMGGGYAALSTPVAGRRGTREISHMRLLMAVRNGEAKVVGIDLDD
jgi:hypothetical protein